jgi:catechol 2,3-dioxygenase-like lactoylglutathione lyase family enzyme
MKLMSAIPALPVKDIKKSIDFYHEKLGFTIDHSERGYGVISYHEVEIHLWLADDEEWRNRSEGECPVISGAESFISGTASCRLEVEVIDELYHLLKPKNVFHPNTTLGDRPWGFREFDVLDLDGNLITFFERI